MNKIIKIFLALIIITLPALVIFSTDAIAQGQIWHTLVGSQNQETEENAGNGPGGNLPAGTFKPPFRCGLSYWGLTYPTHTAYAVDFNRGGGNDDLGDPVLASAEGDVYYILPKNGQVHIRHKNGYITIYAHMRNIRVGVGDHVQLGQRIGDIGNTYIGPGTISPHLHAGLAKNSSLNTIKLEYDNKPIPASLPKGNSYNWPSSSPKTLAKGPC